MTEAYRDDVRDALDRAGWNETAEGTVTAPNGALWAETNPSLDSGIDAPDRTWSVAFDSGVPATVIVSAALAAAEQQHVPDTAAKDSPRAASTLSSDVLDLLAAIRDAVDVPLSALTEADERAYHALMTRRLSDLHATLSVTLSPEWVGILDPAREAAEIRTRTAGTPVTYTVWQTSEATPDSGEQPTCGRCRHPFDPNDTRFDGHAQHGTTPFCKGCVDRCHESTDAFHRCPVCDPTTTNGGAR